MNKPSDFLLGLLDFFAVLVPGACAMWLVFQYLPDRFGCYLDVGISGAACAQADRASESMRWVVLAVGSYLLGHLVFQVSSRLDGVYDRWRLRTKPIDRDRCFQQAKKLAGELTPDLTGEFSVLKWARTFVQFHSPAACLDVDRLEAMQKLFRSLVVVAAVAGAHFLLVERAIGPALAGFAFAVLSFQRFCDQRWKMTELAYASAVIIHATRTAKPAAAPPTGC